MSRGSDLLSHQGDRSKGSGGGIGAASQPYAVGVSCVGAAIKVEVTARVDELTIHNGK